MVKPVTRAQMDANRTAAKILQTADLYQRCQIYRNLVNATVWLSDEETIQSMAITGTDLRKGKYL